MLSNLFSVGLDVLALVLPISIAATNIVFFPLAAVWLFGGRWTFQTWRPTWGWPEKLFILFVGVSLLSSLLGVDIRHSLREIKNKDFYILIMITLAALIRDPAKNNRLLNIFMGAALFTAVFGILQFVIGVNLSDKTNGEVFYLPTLMKTWPQPMINLFTMINGRVIGTRSHPISYAICLLFNWAFALCFLTSSRGQGWMKWTLYLLVTGGALLVSQSRGPWLAAGILAIAAAITSSSKRGWILLGLCGLFTIIFLKAPVLKNRAQSILDQSHHSNKERVHMWQAGYEMWKSHPLLGVGPGNVKGISPAYQTPDEKVWGAWGHLHSTYVNFLVERGLLGLLAFFLFLGAIVREIWQASARTDDPQRKAFYKAAILGMAGFLLSGLTETAYNTAVVIMTFYFVLGLALASARHETA